MEMNNFTFLPFNHGERAPFDWRRGGGMQSCSGRVDTTKKIFSPSGNRTPIVYPAATDGYNYCILQSRGFDVHKPHASYETVCKTLA